MTSRTFGCLVAAATVALLVACGGSDPSVPATATNEPALGVITYSRGHRTGLDALDVLLQAIAIDNVPGVIERLAFVEMPCTAESDPIPGPVCPSGTTVGSLVSAFPRASCEFTFEPAAAIGPVVEDMLRPGLQLYAAYRVDTSTAVAPVPAGDFGLVFIGEYVGASPARPVVDAITVAANGRIVSWASSCGGVDPADFVSQLPVAGFILLPLE